MDVDFPAADVEGISDPQRQCGSSSVVELDVDFTSGREVQAEGSVEENLVAADRLQVDSDQLGGKGSSYVHDGLENTESFYDKSHSLATEFIYDQERMQPALEIEDCQGEVDDLSGSYFHKSSLRYMEKTSHSERGTEDSAHSQESPITINDVQREEMEGGSNLDRKTTPDEEEENSYWQENEAKNENYDSRNSPTESGRMDASHSHPHSPEGSPLTGRRMTVSLERSLQAHRSSQSHRPLSSLEDIQEPSHAPASTRHKESSSNERLSRHRHRQSLSPKRSGQAEEAPSQDHVSSSRKRTSDSPRKCRSASPKSHDLPKHKRLEKSVSRSPVRHRDSSSRYKRDHRHRSRSRSPYKRHHRSSRGRYSPRQRSPSGYHSSHHSPRHRPWAPPPNRKTGLGKPGNNLFVAGFSFQTTERDLERKFSRFGRVRDVRIVRDKRSGDSRGFGFLSLERDEDADAAIRALDETEWNGRIILVEKSKSH